MTPIALATEDVLSEEIGKRLIQELDGFLVLGTTLRKGGSGYLRSRLDNFRQMALNHQPILLITDLDKVKCASKLRNDWFGPREVPPALVFRVAVREVEAWLLADHDAVRSLFRRPQMPLPGNPDEIPDPKSHLVQLARRAPREVREALVPEAGSTSVQGLGYNQLLVGRFLPQWSLDRASQRSESLRRARFRLHEFAQGMQ